MNDERVRDIIGDNHLTKGLYLLEDRPNVDSLSENDQFTSDEMERFRLNSRNIRQSIITGSESFPGEMQSPSTENVLLSELKLNLMVAYYTATYITYKFRAPADEIDQDSITIRVKMNQFGRCRIGSETFGSKMLKKVHMFWPIS